MTPFWNRQWEYASIGLLAVMLVAAAPFIAIWPFFWALGYLAKKVAPNFWSPFGDR